MTNAGPIKPQNGTRFEFRLSDDSREDAVEVRYTATIFRDDSQWNLTLVLNAAAVVVQSEDPMVPDDAKHQLLALARTLTKRKDDEPWPRRVLRWRQPGVR
jgi:hypothetical protein